MHLPFITGSTAPRVPAEVTSLEGFLEKARIELVSSSPKAIHVQGQGSCTGALFIEAVRAVALPSEIVHAEKRYGISLENLKSKTTLTHLDILAFATPIADVHEDTLRVIEHGHQSNEDSHERLVLAHAVHTAPQREQIARLVKSVATLTESESVKTAGIKNKRLVKDLTRLSVEQTTLTLDQFNEVLAKKLALGFLEEGMHLPLPTFIDPATGEEAAEKGHFIVQKVIKEKGLMAFALVPENAPSFIKPTLLFRPTTPDLSQENALQTLRDDLCHNVGKGSFEEARSRLTALLEDPSFLPEGQRAYLCGFSLGGAHAARMLAASPDKFSRAVFFNDPSTEVAVNEEFHNNLRNSSHSEKAPLEIAIYHTDRDIVPLAGEMHIGFFTGQDLLKNRCSVARYKVIDEAQGPSVGPLTRARLHIALLLSNSQVILEAPVRSLEGRVSINSVSSTPRRLSSTRVVVLSSDTLDRRQSPGAIKFNKFRSRMSVIRTLVSAILGLCWGIGMVVSYMAKTLQAHFYSVSDLHQQEFNERASRAYTRVCMNISDFQTPRLDDQHLAQFHRAQPHAWIYDLA